MRRKRKQTEFQCGGCGEFLPNEGFCNDAHAALAKSLKVEEAKHAKNVVLHFSKKALDQNGWTVNNALEGFRDLLRQEHDTARAERANRREVITGPIPAAESQRTGLRVRFSEAPQVTDSWFSRVESVAPAPLAVATVWEPAPTWRSFRDVQNRALDEVAQSFLPLPLDETDEVEEG